MKPSHYFFLAASLISLIGLTLAIVGVFHEREIVEVPCYDKYSNVIKDQICLEEELDYYSNLSLHLILIALVFFLVAMVSSLKEGGYY